MRRPFGRLPNGAGWQPALPDKQLRLRCPTEAAQSENARQVTIFTALLFASVIIAAAQPPPPPSPANKRPFTFEDMMALKRVSEPNPSPDGKWIAFAAQDVDLGSEHQESRISGLFRAGGGPARRLSETPNDEERPRFSPDGKRLIWTSKATDPAPDLDGRFRSNQRHVDRPAAPGHQSFDRSRRRHLVAGWQTASFSLLESIRIAKTTPATNSATRN